ncbi:MAG TPA: 4Fe-4S binding protein [Firmicutes bacterium]|nr:4Fe-4S binding protein [Bacillota bacterium]
MRRKIVHINEEKCNGCGLCVAACHEGALQMVDGKAKLVSESYCDGLGDCLPECPTGAIIIEEREAAPYDEAAVQEHLEKKSQATPIEPDLENASPPFARFKLECGCPGTAAREIKPTTCPATRPAFRPATRLPVQEDDTAHNGAQASLRSAAVSQLRQWPCQLRLVSVNAPYFDHAHLLIAADCTAYAYAGMHEDFMRGKITLIACPKLDHYDYAEKLAEILELHEIRSITILRMEVPCCGGLVEMVKSALRKSGRLIPWHVTIIATDGSIVEEC